jgi:hypothetical protein
MRRVARRKKRIGVVPKKKLRAKRFVWGVCFWNHHETTTVVAIAAPSRS